MYLHELTTFPSAKHDDQVDSTSQALDWAKGRRTVFGLTEFYKMESARLNLTSVPSFEALGFPRGSIR